MTSGRREFEEGAGDIRPRSGFKPGVFLICPPAAKLQPER
jgi:hypothetical protein